MMSERVKSVTTVYFCVQARFRQVTFPVVVKEKRITCDEFGKV